MKISVVTPSYNEVDKIGKYLESIMNQTVFPYEVIIVDGGSKDGTVDIIKDFQGKNRRIKLLKGSHRGPANDRNIGWKAAKGTHILFFDADSQVEKDFIETVQKIIESKSSKENLVIQHSIINSWYEVVKKFMWYGRTMPRYWVKNKSDFGILARMIISLGILILPFVSFIQVFNYIFILFVSAILLIALRNSVGAAQLSGSAVYFVSTMAYVILSFISTGLGLVSIPILKVVGKYTVGR